MVIKAFAYDANKPIDSRHMDPECLTHLAVFLFNLKKEFRHLKISQSKRKTSDEKLAGGLDSVGDLQHLNKEAKIGVDTTNRNRLELKIVTVKSTGISKYWLLAKPDCTTSTRCEYYVGDVVGYF